MFGFVRAAAQELSQEQKDRYAAVYCGICRQIGIRCGKTARMVLRYDMAFLALLLMSLYEVAEEQGDRACGLHPIKPRPWTDNIYIQYAADMNVALAYHKCRDDWQDDKNPMAGCTAAYLNKSYKKIQKRYPNQCAAIEDCMTRLAELERSGCENPDLPAGCFGKLMGALMVYEQDHWSHTLTQLGDALGRFIYLADAAVDLRRDLKKGSYNPFSKMGQDWAQFDEYLTMIMGRCTAHYEYLPLVQDKPLLDNILYSGIWTQYRKKQKEEQK